jgi:hypothetical protein
MVIENPVPKIPLNNEVFNDNDKVKHKRSGLGKILTLTLLVIFLAILGIGVVTVILAMPMVAEIKRTAALAQETYQAAKSQDLVTADKKIKDTHNAIKNVRRIYIGLGWTNFVPILSSYYKDGNNFLQAAESGVEAGQVLIEAVSPYADVLGLKGKGSFTGGTAQDRIIKIIQTLGEVTPKLGEVRKNLEVAQASLNKIDSSRYPTEIKGMAVRSEIIKAKELADQAVVAVAEAQPTLEVLPTFLGYPDVRKYLLIMQNDAELRATGGFMTAFAVLRVEGGKITPERSGDIYSLDQANKNKVKAPEAIAKYLLNADLKTGLVPYWYMRDMNLSPDFKVSMATFKQYYDQLPAEGKAEGIIAIDTKFLKDLLTILGPVEVAGYGKFTMDKDPRCHNIPQVICELEQIVGTPLPTMKSGRKDILGPLMSGIMTKTFDSPSSIWPSLFQVAMNDIREKHILFYFDNEKMQQAAEILHAAGKIEGAKQDYLHVNDTNFGGAKSNMFTQYLVEQNITVKEGNKIEKTLALTYTNPEPMDNCNLERTKGLCLNGVLRNYLRVYVPKGSKLIEGAGSESDIKTYDELDKTVFEGFFTLRGDGGRAKVVLTYELPFTFDQKQGYDLFIQKQPGTVGNHQVIIFGDKKEEFDLTTDRELKF